MRLKTPGPGAKAVVYGRFSSDMQNPKSAEDQIAEGQNICRRLNWDVADIFMDKSKSGRSIKKRPGYLNMMDMAVSGQVDVIVVEDLSRLGRNAAELTAAAQVLKEVDVVIFTFSSGVISGVDLVMRAAWAEEQSEEMGRRGSRGQRASASRGRIMGGVAYGYRLKSDREAGLKNSDGGTDATREVDPDEAAVIVRAYKDYVAGVSTQQICAAFNSEGIKSPGGKLWRPKALTGDKHLLNGILCNPLYVGKAVYGKSRTKFISSTGSAKVKPGEVVDRINVDVPHLKIVDEELWEAVQERLAKRSTTVPNNSRRPQYVLSGLVRCGLCNEPYSIVGVDMGCTGVRLGNGCTNRRRIGRPELEAAVFDGMKERLLQPHILDIYLDEYRAAFEQASAEYADRSASAADRKKDLENEYDNLMKQARLAVDEFTRGRLGKELATTGEQIRQIERDIKRTAPKHMVTLEAPEVIARMSKLLEELGSGLNGPERAGATTRDALRSMIDKITVKPAPAQGKEDRRGVGPVTIAVHGSLTRILDYASGDRVIQRRGTTVTTLDHPNVTFEYAVDFTPEKAWSERPSADVEMFSRLLDDNNAPVSTHTLSVALYAEGDEQVTDAGADAQLRARRAIEFLQKRDAIRAVRLENRKAGWVWSAHDITDQRWRELARMSPAERPQLTLPRPGVPAKLVLRIGRSIDESDDGD
ncbi:MAG: recombinase family protein [Brevundimonas sp.]